MRIAVGTNTVSFDAAAPAVGFTMEVKDTGPGAVEVRFVSEDHESRFKADFASGVLRVEIDERD